MAELFKSISGSGVTAGVYFLSLAVSLICGAMTAIASTVKSRSSKSFFVSLVLLPAIVCTVIIMVNGNVGTGVAVMGAFGLVRFRSAAGKAKEIALIFTSMTAGLACAAGYVGVSLIFTLIICAVSVLLTVIPVNEKRDYDLRITIPESLNYCGAFDGILSGYTSKYRLVSVKTTNMGGLYRLHYSVTLKDISDTKRMIDDLRTVNGNLEVAVCEAEEAAEEL